MLENFEIEDRDAERAVGGLSEEAAVEAYYAEYLRANCNHCKRLGGTCMLGIRQDILNAIRAHQTPKMRCDNLG